MSLYSQFALLRSLSSVSNGVLTIRKNTKQDIGNYGRQYNILNVISRADRAYISNLYGFDMESALQVIVLKIMEYWFPDEPLPLTEIYVSNKRQVRTEISEMMSWNLNRTKMEITAIYQGRFYTKKNYLPLQEYFEERDEIMNNFMVLMSDYIHNKDKFDEIFQNAIHYAGRRTNQKLESEYKKSKADYYIEDYWKVDKRKKKNKYGKYPYILDNKVRNGIRKTFTFFLWTFFERQAQDVISSYFEYPHTLHDAVYTQDKEEYDKVSIKEIEQKVLEVVNIPLRLSVA